MSDEIKEILDRLERIDHKEYSCGFEFADSGSFDEDCRCFEERKKMANYITNLQQEKEDYKSRVENAVEYIKWQQENPQYDNVWRKYECESLINILQGSKDDKLI